MEVTDSEPHVTLMLDMLLKVIEPIVTEPFVVRTISSSPEESEGIDKFPVVSESPHASLFKDVAYSRTLDDSDFTVSGSSMLSTALAMYSTAPLVPIAAAPFSIDDMAVLPASM